MTRVFSIPPGVPFLATLADALVSGRLVPDFPDPSAPEALSRATIFLPTRRAARALVPLLAERAGRLYGVPALVLPRIVPLGEADDAELEIAAGIGETEDGAALAPPIAPLERRLLLARLIQGWSRAMDPRRARLEEGVPFLVPSSPADAVGLAAELEALMDDVAYEGVSWQALKGAVGGDHSKWFDLTRDFLSIAFEAWPLMLEERGAADPAARRTALIDAEAARLTRSPPAGPVIAAGSTGSIPATARLLAAIARLPQGAVVLPGLDRDLDASAWRHVCGDEEAGIAPVDGHPQAVLARLVSGALGLEHGAVETLGVPDDAARARERLLAEAMRPAETTDAWAGWAPAERAALAAAGTDGITLIEAPDERREALCVALALRETLETPGATAALITPDRELARRVCVELARWGVSVDDSAGTSLAESPAGALARLAAEAAAEDFTPLATLALLQHPAVRLGLPRDELARARSALEIGVLRGPEPGPGLPGLRAAARLRRDARNWRDPRPVKRLGAADWDAAEDLLARLAAAFAPLLDITDGEEVALPALAAPHRAAFDALIAPPLESEDEDQDDGDPFADGSEEALATLFDDLALVDASAALRGTFLDYPAFFATLARQRRAPGRGAEGHPRLKILGLLEARLIRADRVVIGGLDEGVWPPKAETDPFLNRPLRTELGLAPPERRLGQTAHDLVQALGTPDAVVTRAASRGGAPTVPSRFLQRLAAFAGEAATDAMRARGAHWLALAERLERAEPAPPLQRPAPKPDPSLFPKRLSVTAVETLVRDPYAIFARHILGLDALEPVGAAPGVSERGTLVHDTLADFVMRFPDALPDRETAAVALRQIALDRFAPIADAYPELRAEWWPRFERVADAFLAWEYERRPGLAAIAVERDGKLVLDIAGAPFELTARADRIEIARDGTPVLVDYKTGAPPTSKVVFAGFSPQLTLEAAILRGGGFADLPRADGPPTLLYVHASGRRKPFEPCPIAPPKGEERTVADLVSEHLARLEGLVARFRRGDYAYLSRPYAQYAKRYSDYDHLARVKEWSAAAGSDAGEDDA